MKYAYGQIIEVRNRETQKWERRVFVRMEGDRAMCADSHGSAEILSHSCDVPTCDWVIHRPISDPNAFVDGELCANKNNGDLFRASRGYPAAFYRRPTIEEARKLLPWCNVEAK